MRVAPENIFPGARIRLGEEIFYVIKVNAKSFYASTMTYNDYIEKYNSRATGVTFTAFCKLNDITSHKYTEPFEVEENEFSKAIVIENSVTSYKLNKTEKCEIMEMIKHWKKKKGTVKFTPLFMAGSKSVYFLDENKNSYLANIDKNYVLFDLDNDEWIKISTVFDYNYDHVPWEKLSTFTSAEMTA